MPHDLCDTNCLATALPKPPARPTQTGAVPVGGTRPQPAAPAQAVRGLVVGVTLALGAVAWAAPVTTTIRELAVVSKDHTFTRAGDINEAGNAVGVSGAIANNEFAASVATFWGATAPGPQALPRFAGVASLDAANALNNHDVVVGRVGDKAVRWTPTSTGVYGTEPSLYGPLSAGSHSATGINDSGVAIGGFWKCASTDCSTGNTRAWRSGPGTTTLQEVGPSTGFWTYADAVDAAGNVLVVNTPGDNSRVVQVIAPDGSATTIDLSRRVAGTGGGTDMNDTGRIAAYGLVDTGSASIWESFVWSGGTEYVLDSLVAGQDAQALAINNLGWVVGWSGSGLGAVRAATFWAGLGAELVWDLNDLLSEEDAALWKLETAVAISDSGWIAGNGLFLLDKGSGTWVERGYAMQLGLDFTVGLKPPPWAGGDDDGGTVPEPGSLALIGLAGLAALRRRKR